MEVGESILKELRIIRMLLVAERTQSSTQKDSIAILARAGLGPADIADTLGTTPNTVSVALSDLRKAGKLRRPGKRQAR